MDRTDVVTVEQEPAEMGVADVVMQALRVAGLPVTSLGVALVADELLRLGSRIAGVERRPVKCPACAQLVDWLPDIRAEMATVACHGPSDEVDCPGSLARVPRPSSR